MKGPPVGRLGDGYGANDAVGSVVDANIVSPHLQADRVARRPSVSPRLQAGDWDDGVRVSRVTMLKHGANGDIDAWPVHIGVRPFT